MRKKNKKGQYIKEVCFDFLVLCKQIIILRKYTWKTFDIPENWMVIREINVIDKYT